MYKPPQITIFLIGAPFLALGFYASTQYLASFQKNKIEIKLYKELPVCEEDESKI